jgi:hypothetical protein
MAVVVPRLPGALSAEEVLTFCADKLACCQIPRHVVCVETLLRNAMGKVLKAELRALYRPPRSGACLIASPRYVVPALSCRAMSPLLRPGTGSKPWNQANRMRP